jgi:hypothetical protein
LENTERTEEEDSENTEKWRLRKGAVGNTAHADSESRERGKKIVLRKLKQKTSLAYVVLVF